MSDRPRTQVPSAPVAVSEVVRARFSRQKSRDTTPELLLRRELHGRGMRFRVDYAPLPGVRRRADVVFTRLKVAIFVDGCYWHRCPEHGTEPKSNADWWRQKLDRNVERDRDTDTGLQAAGWAVLRIWEHEDMHAAADLVEATLRLRMPEV